MEVNVMEGKDPMNRPLFCHEYLLWLSLSLDSYWLWLWIFFIVKCIFVLGFIFVNLSCSMYALTWSWECHGYFMHRILVGFNIFWELVFCFFSEWSFVVICWDTNFFNLNAMLFSRCVEQSPWTLVPSQLSSAWDI